jgi:hypothetical protein
MMFLHPAGRNEKAFPQWPQKCLLDFSNGVLKKHHRWGQGGVLERSRCDSEHFIGRKRRHGISAFLDP